MTSTTALEEGRRSIRQHAWTQAHASFSDADRDQALEPDDLERLATAAYLVGHDRESTDLRIRLHDEYVRRGQRRQAAGCAVWLSLTLTVRGELSQGAGWLARARRALEEEYSTCVEHGYVRYAEALRSVLAGDTETACAGFGEAVAMGEQFGDADLAGLGRMGQGRALIRLGQTSRGTALLDETMAAVTSGGVSPIVAGLIYCSVVDACHEMFDVRRAREWTSALSRWCDREPDMVPYRGQCLVQRAEIMQDTGAWAGALDEAERARDWLSRPPAHRGVGAAWYRLGELYRLRGETARAEQAYKEASRAGRDPQPGLALLRLAQGQVDVARAAIGRAVEESRLSSTRGRLLPAAVEIALAGGDVAAARAAADELAALASLLRADFLRAVASMATGAVLLAEGDARAALGLLRPAWELWRDLEAPYEAARARVLIGQACRALGDGDSAALELDAARQTFHRLGAAPDRDRVGAPTRGRRPGLTGGLTAREGEVLGLIASGATNRTIAQALGISEKTVARHASNIFAKLGLANRAAATAYAYRHGLVAGTST